MEDKMTNSVNGRIYWIDMAKAAAILAVLVDHTRTILYDNMNYLWSSYYSVSLFTLIMGVNFYGTISKENYDARKTVRTRLKGLILPYLVATFVYQCVMFRFWDFSVYLDYVIHFNISGPFYYVLQSIQLFLAAPVLGKLFQKTNQMARKYALFIETAGFLVVLIISVITTQYTNVLSVYGGGGKLFAGTYLALFYLGMWFGKYYQAIRLHGASAYALCAACLVALFSWNRFLVTDRLQLDNKMITLSSPLGGGESTGNQSGNLCCLDDAIHSCRRQGNSRVLGFVD